MALIDDLPKRELLIVLKSVPQNYWPPRPTRQTKEVLVHRIRQSMYRHEETRVALAAAWKRNKCVDG